MSEQMVGVRITSDKRAALDAMAAKSGRDIGDVIDDALSASLELHSCQVAHLEEGLRQADAGEFASDAELGEAFRGWRR